MRILIIGLGAIGQRHARNLRRLLGDQLVLSAFRQRGSTAALTDTLELEPNVAPETRLDIRIYHDLAEALATKPDGVVIANPSSMHLAHARLAVEAGCTVFVEKPLSHTWEGIPEFLHAVGQRAVPVLVGYQWRLHPVLLRTRELLAEHAVGRLIAVNATYGEYLPNWHAYEDYRTSYASRRDQGGGVLLTQVHDIDYLGWLLGWPTEVYSIGGHLSDLDVSVEDTSSTLWRCIVDARAIPVHLHQDMLQTPPVRACEFIGERGRMHCDLLRARLQVWYTNGRAALDETFSAFERNDMFLAEMRHFVGCIERRETPRVSALDAARSLAVALAAHRSHVSGQIERVDAIEESKGAAPGR